MSFYPLRYWSPASRGFSRQGFIYLSCASMICYYCSQHNKKQKQHFYSYQNYNCVSDLSSSQGGNQNETINNMIQQQYKQPEQQRQKEIELDDQEIQNFVNYLQFKKEISTVTTHFYDWDVNLRQNRQHYINKKHHTQYSQQSSRVARSRTNTLISQKSSKKSTKQKVEYAKKTDLSMVIATGKELKSREDPPSRLEQMQQSDVRFTFLPQNIPQYSKIENASSPLNLNPPPVEQQEHREVEKEESFQIPEQKRQEQPTIVVLPMLDQSSTKKYYYGNNKPKIEALNDFMKEPVQIQQVPLVHSKIMMMSRVKHPRNNKTESSKMSTPVHKSRSRLEDQKKEQNESLQIHQGIAAIDNLISDQSITPRKMKKKVNQYAYVPVDTPVPKERKDNSRSKSKSISKVKKVKASSLFNPRPKIYEPPAPYAILQHQKYSNRQSTPSPQVNHEPITHSKQLNQTVNLNNRSRIFSSKKTARKDESPLPVQDYDPIFDKPRGKKSQREESPDDIDENIEARTPNNNKGTFSRSDSKVSQDGNDHFLQYFAIPLHHLKKKQQAQRPQSSKINAQQSRINEQSEPRHKQVHISYQPEPDHPPIRQLQPPKQPQAVTESQRAIKSSARRRIFSQQQQQPSQKNTISTDGTEYTDEEMRMLLAARGNKYKETIVRQYIKMQRAQHAS